MRARRGLKWVLSLRNRVEQRCEKSEFLHRLEAASRYIQSPPTFYNSDSERWKKKFESPNKLLGDERAAIAQRFHYAFEGMDRSTTSTFSTVDVPLMHGNAGEFSDSIKVRGRVGAATKDQLGFPFLLRKYRNETSFAAGKPFNARQSKYTLRTVRKPADRNTSANSPKEAQVGIWRDPTSQ